MSSSKALIVTTLSEKIAMQRRLVGLSLVILGLIFVGIVGFLPIDAVHNAAHDTRHLSGFPCH